jgi:hypothetical protein
MEATTQQETLLENSYIKFSYDHRNHYIIKEWKQSVSASKFKDLIVQLLMQILQIRIKYRTNITILADCRKLSGETFTPEVIDWLNTNVHQIYAKNKIAKKAFVAPQEVEANLSLVSYITNSSSIDGFEMLVFNDIEEAKKWLIS